MLKELALTYLIYIIISSYTTWFGVDWYVSRRTKGEKTWSEGNDALLDCYLKPYFQKVLRANRELVYNDCCAGKGSFEYGKPISPFIALEVMNSCTQNSTCLINKYGITLASLDEAFCEQMELGAAHLMDSLMSFENLHKQDCRTWISIEPYPTPSIIEHDLGELLSRIHFINRIIIGRIITAN